MFLFHVIQNTGEISKSSRTKRTGMQSAGCSEFVLAKMLSLDESSIASRTFVRPFPGVQTQVIPQVTGVDESFIAVLTRVRSGGVSGVHNTRLMISQVAVVHTRRGEMRLYLLHLSKASIGNRSVVEGFPVIGE